MQLHPTRATFHVAMAGAGLVALGAAARLAPVVGFGGAMLLAVALGRAFALVAVTRLRAAGFEMVWTAPARVHRVARGTEIVLEAELRNRGGDAVRGVSLRPIASSMLNADVEPTMLDLHGGGRALINVRLRAPRVGWWGVHGLALEVRGTPWGGDGMYEVPLLFANPVGVEVFPASLTSLIASPRGGRARRAPPSAPARGQGVSRQQPGEGDELRELRDHLPGDPYKRIAWRASARRGRLLVREMEREQRDVVWLVVDASVDLWAGALGEAPLDRVVDDAAAVATARLRRGDHVGLIVTASRLRSWLAPERGPAHAAAIAKALAGTSSCLDADRSQLDENEVAARVVEHARPLDPEGLTNMRKGDLDALVRSVEKLRARAPFAPPVPFADTAREQTLRHYLAAFGIESPPRIDGEREKAEVALAEILERLALEKRRATTIHVWAPPPIRPARTGKAIAALRRRRFELLWSIPPFEGGLGHDRDRRSPVADVIDEAVRRRANAMRMRGERLLRRMGIHVVPRAIARASWPSRQTDSEAGGGSAVKDNP